MRSNDINTHLVLDSKHIETVKADQLCIQKYKFLKKDLSSVSSLKTLYNKLNQIENAERNPEAA